MSFLSARKKTGMSQAEVGKRLGVSDATVSMWETGVTTPVGKRIPQIAALYGCSIDELFKSDEEIGGNKNKKEQLN